MRLVIALLTCSVVCYATDWSSLYQPDKLAAQTGRLRIAINYLVQNEIAPFVPEQASTSFGLQSIDLPPSGFRSNPLDFYSQGNHIVLPAETLLFLEDLARCYGWLWTNHFTTRTVDEYLSMLRYRSASSFPGGKYPVPLTALHIPDGALSDPHVVEASVRLRRTAYAFILLHQFGHLQLHHDVKANGGYSEQEEETADRYALEIMKNNSVTPTGLLLVMHSFLFFEGADASALHPVSAHRLDAMAHFLNGRVAEFVGGRPDRSVATSGIFNIASLLEEGAEWLSVRGHDEALQQLAEKTDASTLEPRPLPKTTR